MAEPTHPGMVDQTNSNIARDGAAKRPQTSFAPRPLMKNQTSMGGIGPGSTGPDADPPAPLANPSPAKSFPALQPKWGQRDGNGEAYDASLAGRVLDDATLKIGSAPASTNEQTASGANPVDPYV